MAEPAYCKRLKAMEPDLSVTCRRKDDRCDTADGENQHNADATTSQHEKTFQCHSFYMAYHSEFFDSMLSSRMSEAESKEVTLEDVSPETFELAMDLLEDGFAGTLKKLPGLDTGDCDAVLKMVQATEFYNRFGFQNALKSAEEYLDGYIRSFSDKEPPSSKEVMETIIQVVLLSDQAPLLTLRKSCVAYLHRHVKTNDYLCMGILSLGSLEKLHPFFAAHFSDKLSNVFDMPADAGPIKKNFMERSDFPYILSKQLKMRRDAKQLERMGHRLEILTHSHLPGYDFELKAKRMIRGKRRIVYHAPNIRRAVYLLRNEYDPTKGENGDLIAPESSGASFGDWLLHIELDTRTRSMHKLFFPFSGSEMLPPDTASGWKVYESPGRNNNGVIHFKYLQNQPTDREFEDIVSLGSILSSEEEEEEEEEGHVGPDGRPPLRRMAGRLRL